MKKVLMIFLVLVFAGAIGLLFLSAKDHFSPKSAVDVLPTPTPTPTLSPESSLPTPTPPPELIQLENEFLLLEEDVGKIKEDKRLNPPVFNFDLGI